MFSSLKWKIIFFISLILIITGVVIVFYTRRDVGRAILEAEESSAKIVLELVELNISGGYNKLLYDKLDLIMSLTERLKNISTICVSVFDEYSKLTQTGIISEPEARKKSLQWLESLNFQNGQAFAFDDNAVIIAHPDTTQKGRSVALIRDIKGRNIAKAMTGDALKYDGESAVFSWFDNQSKKKKKARLFSAISQMEVDIMC